MSFAGRVGWSRCCATDTEQKLLDSVIRKPTDFLSLNSATRESLETLRNILERSVEASAVAAGYQPSQSSEQSQGSSKAGEQRVSSTGVS